MLARPNWPGIVPLDPFSCHSLSHYQGRSVEYYWSFMSEEKALKHLAIICWTQDRKLFVDGTERGGCEQLLSMSELNVEGVSSC